MSEYWVSKNKYYCKYCKIFIADDAPSRKHHETGLKHKGNYERFIRNLYKDGERSIKEKQDEEREMDRINRAAHASMGMNAPAPSSSKKAASSSSRKGSGNVWDNYTTAESLGVVSQQDLEAAELKSNQVNIGQWQKVTKPSARPAAAPVEQRAEDERPTTKKYLKEKTATLDQDEFDPSKIVFKTIKKRNASEALDVEPKNEVVRDENVNAELASTSSSSFKQGGFQPVEVKDEPLPSFEELVGSKPVNEPPVKQDSSPPPPPPKPAASSPVEEQDIKPSTSAGSSFSGGFKKRKMHGANAVRKT